MSCKSMIEKETLFIEAETVTSSMLYTCNTHIFVCYNIFAALKIVRDSRFEELQYVFNFAYVDNVTQNCKSEQLNVTRNCLKIFV